MDREERLKLSDMDPEFKKMMESQPLLEMPKDILAMREPIAKAVREKSAQSVPGVLEDDITIPARDGYRIPARIYRPENIAAGTATEKEEGGGGGPLVVMYHGGGYAVGVIEMEAENCRNLVKYFGATCVNVDYRLAPEHPFPTGPLDAWDALKWTAANHSTHPLLQTSNPTATTTTGRSGGGGGSGGRGGFLVGGTSAGGNFAAVVAHLAKDERPAFSPPLTGIYLCIPALLPPQVVPAQYADRYLSMEQNRDAPLLSRDSRKMFLDAYRPDLRSELFAPFNWPTGHRGLAPRCYFQVCGLDPLRDEALIFEEVLREDHHQVETRLDVYPGAPHGFWKIYPTIRQSKKFRVDTIKGFAWLLNRDVDVDVDIS